ncbi:MAG: hypothetical protein ACJAT5_000684 [Lentimonas sp.]|jgi:hypothetical protein
MFLQNHQNPLRVFIFSAIAVFSIGCDPAQPTVYEIPKEVRSANVTIPSEQNTPPATDPAKMQILPGMQETADSASGISFSTPEGWEELEPSGIRKGNFKINSENGIAEVTILTFPGDVGGTLSNINRWRDQVGLEAVISDSISEFSEPCEIAKHRGLYVSLEGETQSILGAMLPFHGNTWFFKMLGDTPVVLANDEAMKQFLESVQFTDHAH